MQAKLGTEGCGPLAVLCLSNPVAYAASLAQQQSRWAEVAAGNTPDTLFLLEHTPTITLGRDTKPEHLLRQREELAALGIDVVEADRGGGVTYHGPGQFVAYPILNLNHWKCSVSWYLRTLEQVVIDTLADFGLHGERLEGYTGVWVGGAKIAAIGIGIRKWVTFHGLALNVAPDMEHFKLIVPCGIADKPVTSMALLTEMPPSIDEVREQLVKHFAKALGRDAICVKSFISAQ